MKKRLFTLIKLLVVVALILVLLGLLMPALKGARDTVKATVCQSNLRQSSIVAANYSADFNNYVYVTGQDPFAVNASCLWDNNGWAHEYSVTVEYVKPSSIFLCPSEFPYRMNTKDSRWCHWVYGADYTNTSANPLISVAMTASANKNYRNAGRMRLPSRYIYLCDSFTSDSANKSQCYQILYTAQWGAGAALRHRSRSNSAFFDGHVQGVDRIFLKENGYISAFIGENRSYAVTNF